MTCRRLAAHHHRVAVPAGQRLGQRLRRIERLPPLVQRHLRQVGAEPHLARIGRQRAGQQVQQRRLAGAVGADDADPVAAQDAGGEVAHHHPVAERFRHALGHR